jgi:hypothetical protein
MLHATAMKIKLTAFLIFCVFHFTAFSQDSCAKKFVERTLFLYGNRYQINGKPLKFKELKVELNKFADAAEEYRQFHKGSTIAGIISLGALIAELTGALVYKNNHALGNGLMIGAGVSVLVSMPISITARNHLQKSVWRYNKDVMSY